MTATLGFGHPWVLLFLLVLPLYGIARRRAARTDRVPWAPLQVKTGARPGPLMSRLALGVEILLLAVVVVGLAGPYRETRLELVDDPGVDVLLVLDISLSMLAEDFPPNRLEALREIARDFINRSGGNRVGLVVFAKDTFVQVPLTTDHSVLIQLLEGVSTKAIDQEKSGGTAIGDALLVGADQLDRSRIPERDQALVLITDGESNMGLEPLKAARYVRHVGARFYAIGIGGLEPVEVRVDGEILGGEDDPYLAFLDDADLRSITEAAGGRYWRATDVGTLEEIFADLSRLEHAPLEVRELEIRDGYSHLAALAALPLFALHLVLGGVVVRRPFR